MYTVHMYVCTYVHNMYMAYKGMYIHNNLYQNIINYHGPCITKMQFHLHKFIIAMYRDTVLTEFCSYLIYFCIIYV